VMFMARFHSYTGAEHSQSPMLTRHQLAR